jgi:hypothetical protein
VEPGKQWRPTFLFVVSDHVSAVHKDTVLP